MRNALTDRTSTAPAAVDYGAVAALSVAVLAIAQVSLGAPLEPLAAAPGLSTLGSQVTGALVLAVLFAGGAGLAVGFVFRLLARLPIALGLVFWLGGGLALGAGLAQELGAFSAISADRHAKLGWFALAASLGLGGFVGVVAAVCQPTRRRPAGLAGQVRWPGRIALSLGLSLALAAFLYGDAHWFPLTYPMAHLGLRWAALVAAFGLGWMVRASLPFTRRRRTATRLGLAAAVLVAVPVALTIDVRDRVTLDALLQRPIPALTVRALRTVTDVDFDGYSALLGGGDCAPFSPRVSPGADEIPENGIDDNCVGGDGAPRAAYDVSGMTPPDDPAPVSVVLITIDTVRADRMSLYGYERETTPHIDAWAEDALRFDRAYSAAPWTSLSMAALFRGVYPRRLSWTVVRETSRLRLLREPVKKKLRKGEKAVKTFTTPIEDERRTMSEWLAWRGMRTEAVVDDGRSQFLSRRMGVAGEFDRYMMAQLRGKVRGDASVTKKAKRRLRELAKGEPFFLWVHYFGPHDAPGRSEGKPTWGKDRSDVYDFSLQLVDQQVAKLLSGIEQARKTHDRPIAVALTADHGEEFLSDHRGHGANLKDTNTRVPLVVQGPGFGAGASDAVVSLVDLLPTVLLWTDTPAPAGLDGVALQAVDEHASDRIVLSETWHVDRHAKAYGDRLAAVGTAYKLEWILDDQNQQLRRIGPDGFEIDKNLLGKVEAPALAGAITAYLEQNRRVDVSK